MNEQIGNFLKQFLSDANSDAHDSNTIVLRLGLTALIVVVWYWTAPTLRHLLKQFITQSKRLNVVVSVLGAVLSLIYTLALIRIWLNTADSILLLLLLIVGIIFLAGKNLFDNVVGRILLLHKRYFKLYDRIEIKGVRGEVVKIRMFSFEVMEFGNLLEAEIPTGRTVKIPNKLILSEPVYNYNKGTNIIWEQNTFSVQIGSNWEKAQDLLGQVGKSIVEPALKNHYQDEEIMREVDFKLGLFDGKVEIRQLVNLTEQGIELDIIFPVYYQDVARIKSKIYEEGLRRLQQEPDIELVGSATHLVLNK